MELTKYEQLKDGLKVIFEYKGETREGFLKAHHKNEGFFLCFYDEESPAYQYIIHPLATKKGQDRKEWIGEYKNIRPLPAKKESNEEEKDTCSKVEILEKKLEAIKIILNL